MKTKKLENVKTRLIKAGRPNKVANGYIVNSSVTRASTILFDSIESFQDAGINRDHKRTLTYGAHGTPITYELEDLITELENGYRTRLFPTGLAAITNAITSYVKSGDHILISDSVYRPVRDFAENFLKRFNVDFDYFDATKPFYTMSFKPETTLVYVESPGSILYEIIDLPKLSEYTHEKKSLLMIDSTWSAGYLYKPLNFGADIVISAPTKYLSGHSDLTMGSVTTKENCWDALYLNSDRNGMNTNADDAWLTLRGARTLASRITVQSRNALYVAEWLMRHPLINRVYHPALPSHEGYEIWKRDYSGCNSLVSFSFKNDSNVNINDFVNKLNLFGIGASWGGYESLVMVYDMTENRTCSDWEDNPNIVRLHIGLEDITDLVSDLSNALSVLK
ncbi:cystathionine beta-lyase [Dickeya zeae]|uniref:Cystathionine beta-lyase n=1 Tax=Dickeya zeae TaxID=204042 RepID=A0AAE6Z2U5_9GAMM|nr:cystathionine beta-lyase [Dickeya zeae]QIZ53161.1 cystathionine beta-lyase [Dickeya zeae]